jgi:multiple sugar transport system permease protein
LTIRSAARPGRKGGEAGLWLLALPYIVGLVLLVGLPATLTVGLALFDYDLIRPPAFAGFDNFAELLGDDVFGIVARNSVVFVALAVPLRLLVAVGLALILHRGSMRGGGFYRLAIFLPIVVPETAFAIAWLWLLNPLYGPINTIVAGAGLSPVAWLTDPGSTHVAMVLLSCFLVGEAFVVAIAARRAIPAELHDMAVVDGASAGALLRHVTLPLMLPILLLLALRDAVLALQATFVPTLVITDGGPPPYATTYWPLFVYDQAFEYLRYGYAAAATAILIGITCIIVALQVRILRRWRHWAWA